MKDFWESARPIETGNEADVEVKLILPLLCALGYKNSDIRPKYEVVFQEGRRGRNPEADFVVFYGPLHDRNTSVLVVEAKRPNENFEQAKAQAESYAHNVRAPFVLVTDGIKLEVWQLQASRESDRVFLDNVANIVARRGDIESLIGKEAALQHLRQLENKSILTAAGDLGPYEVSETNRHSIFTHSITRTLRRFDRDVTFNSSILKSECRRGAIVVAASGLGKTMLCQRLHREAIIARCEGTSKLISIELFLPDIAASNKALLAFSHERIEAHCPNITWARFQDMLRLDGAILYCDGFDRILESEKPRVELDIKNIMRDYPKVQIFIFSRKSGQPHIDLPTISLEKLSLIEQRELQKKVLSRPGSDILFLIPPELRWMAESPLLLSLILFHYRDTNTLPSDLKILFQSWLQEILSWDNKPITKQIDRQRAMTILAHATAESSISRENALMVLRAEGFVDEIFDDLIAADALKIDGNSVELLHEALADFLRAQQIANEPLDNISNLIETLQFQPGSLQPTLLMSLLPTRELQKTLWKNLSKLDFESYLTVLRYRQDISNEYARVENSDLAASVLEDILEGYLQPASIYFPNLGAELNQQISGESKGEVGIIGNVYETRHVNFAFRSLIADQKRIDLKEIKYPDSCTFIDLFLSGLRLDSGRLLGMRELKNAIYHLVEGLRVLGGVNLARDRLASRIRFLVSKGLKLEQISPFAAARKTFSKDARKIVRVQCGGRSKDFLIQSLLEDINTLENAGEVDLDFWWQRLGWTAFEDPSDLVAELLLSESYNRAQKIYAEIIEKSFPNVAKLMPFNNCLPVQWKIEVLPDRSINHSWLPVSNWDEAVTKIDFVSEIPSWYDPTRFEKIKAEFQRLGRTRERTRIDFGYRLFPRFDGREGTGGFDGETPAIKLAFEWLKKDIDALFGVLPAS